jgi:ribonuclease HI
MYIFAFCDGGYNKSLNTYYGSYRIYVYNKNNKLIEELSDKFYFPKLNTSPESEYKILVKLLETLHKEYSLNSNINVFTDCLLVVNQVNDLWRIEAKNLKPFYNKAKELIKYFNNLNISWISNKHIKKILGH